MKKYSDYQKDKSKNDLTKEELNKIPWTKYKIIVPTKKDKKELEMAFEHIHYSDIDTDNIIVNQLAHEYLNDDIIEGTYNNIIVDANLFKTIENKHG